jgi:putative hemolysin
VIEFIFPKLLSFPAPVSTSIAHVLGFSALERTYNEICGAEGIESRLLDKLSISIRASQRDLDHIPRSGATLIVSNHPSGILDGAALATLLKRVRSDVRFLANAALSAIPELKNLVLPVDLTTSHGNSRALRLAIEHLSNGGCLVIFPAGEVSHFRWTTGTVDDSSWSNSAVRIVENLGRKSIPVTTVPIYIAGKNSLGFQVGGLVHAGIRTALLVRELLNKRGRTVDVRIGSAVDSAKLLEIPDAACRTGYLRWRTYLLANRCDYKANTSRPLSSSSCAPQAEIAAALDPEVHAGEIAKLVPLISSSQLETYLAPASEIPNVLREIGRLREITFRAAGEGTGNAIDLDRFDHHYLHLFVWHAAKREIVGAYRLCPTQSGDLYTRTLFEYDERFLSKLGPAVELGRSFIRAEYQRGFAPLLALWKGIGRFIAKNPQYRTLFGPVSISNEYQSVSRELMVTYLERHASLTGWMQLIKSRNPFRRGKHAMPANLQLDDLSDAVSDLEPARIGIPVLFRQYLRLGGKLLGFNLDPKFSNALDGLILVDLTKTEPKLVERYLGKSEAAMFFEYQKGQHE